MCSWCWGFSPVLAQLRAQFAANLQFHLVLGGLRPGSTETMNDQERAYILHHWHEVHQRTSQPFRFQSLNREDFIYDTEPASRALVVARELAPTAVFDYLTALHRTFYAEGKDITKPALLAEIAGRFGIAENRFMAAFESPAATAETVQDFRDARMLGINGFPSLVFKNGPEQFVLCRGYQSLEELQPRFEELSRVGDV